MGSILLVAGTCIGSGMIALPMVLAKLGLVCSILLMLLIWWVMYHTSLVNLELNLQADEGLALGALGKRFSGPIAAAIGSCSLKLLSYSLLAVFFYAGASLVQTLCKDAEFEQVSLLCFSALLTWALLLLPVKLIDHINRYLFIGLVITLLLLISGLVAKMEWSDLPLFAQSSHELSVWQAVIPVVFTSFGFQVIFHTLTNYCNREGKILKRAFLWGSFIPAIVYITWSCSILSVVHHQNPLFYQKMVKGEAEIGDLVDTLTTIVQGRSVQLLIWWISLLAILTSIVGVGIGLCDTFQRMVTKKIASRTLCRLSAATLTVVPPFIVSLLIPNAFIVILGFAGMILSIIAILLPTYLLRRAKVQNWYYPELKYRWLLRSTILAGGLIIYCEIANLFTK